MADLSASDPSAHRASSEGAEPFNPLTGGIDDLIHAHQACWLWPEVMIDVQGCQSACNFDHLSALNFDQAIVTIFCA